MKPNQYRGEKRRKELQRKKKNDEKLQRRLEKKKAEEGGAVSEAGLLNEAGLAAGSDSEGEGPANDGAATPESESAPAKPDDSAE